MTFLMNIWGYVGAVQLMAANSSFPSILSWTPPPAPSQNLKVLLAYVNARNKLDNVLRFFHNELEHRYLPVSLGRPVLTKKQYGEYLEALASMMTTYTITLLDVIESSEEDTIVFHAMAHGVSTMGVVYNNEYMTTVKFAPGDWGPRIIFMKEYVDSSKTTEFFKTHRAKVAEFERGRSREHVPR